MVDAETKQPLPDVAVRLYSVGGADLRDFRSGQTKTNAEGVYEFAGIAVARYSVSVESPTYLGPAQFSQVTTQSDKASTADFQLIPGATARGRVVDRAGKPVARARVQLAGRLHHAPAGWARPSVTGADGSFTLTLVPPGEWTMEISLPRTRGGLRPPLLYHPGVLWRQDATTITVAPGETIDNIEVVVPRVIENGLTVHVAASAPVLANVAASLLSVTPLAVHGIALNEHGVGTIKGLIEGRYFVAARAWSSDRAFVGFDAVNIAGDPKEVSLHLRRAGRITGRIVAQRGGLPALKGVRVGAAWIHEDVPVNPLVPDQVDAGPDGRFRIDGLFGTRKIELSGLSQDWRIASVRQGRVDVTGGVNVPLDSTVDLTIVLARR